MSRKTRLTAVLAKLETTYGVDAAPTGAADAVLISNATFDYTYNNVARDNLRSFLGASEQLAGTRFVTMSFDVEMAGSGTTGTAPAWGRLLRACAMAETVTAGSRVEYNPISTGMDSMTIHYFDDGVVHRAVGCMGSAEVVMDESAIPRLRFNFTGIDGGLAAQVNPTQTLTSWRVPQVVTNTNTNAVLLGATYATGTLTGGTSFVSRGINLNLGNEVRFVSMLGTGGADVDIYNREATGSLQLELDAAAEVAAFNAVAANTLTSIGLQHGSTAGNRVLVFAPAVQRINPTHQDFEGRVLIGFDLRLTPLAGNDELRIVAL